MKKGIALIVIFILTLPLIAGGMVSALSYTPSIYLSFPHFEDELPSRTSLSHTITLEAIGYQSDRWSVSTYLPVQIVSPSLAWGSYQARGFSSVGLGARFSYHLDNDFILFGNGGITFNRYRAIEWAFLSFWVEAGLEYIMLRTPNAALSAILPIAVDLRKEITGLEIGLGLRWTFDPKGGLD